MTRRTKPETKLQALVVEALNQLGVEAVRINCGDVAVRRGYMHGAPAGTPDLQLVMWRTSYLETKMPRGGYTKAQPARHAQLIRAGCRVAVVRSVMEALDIVMWWRTEDERVRRLVDEQRALEGVGLG
jgi:hypothetical protein